ncbi:MAG TPA: VOC family protein [Ramlibacter sp.]|jgi:catechol 2,3-dioxygenase-like lactoylglutathione lyase family enzyme
MPALGLNHYNIRAGQPLIGRVRDFYVDVIGLREGARPPFDFPGHWLYAGDAAVVHLVETPGSQAAAAPPDALDHVAFTCTDIDAFEASLKARGVDYRKSGVPGAPVQQLFLKDPAGNGVELNFAP